MSLIQTAAKPSSPLNTFLTAFKLNFGVVNVTNSEDFNTISTLTLDDQAEPGRADVVYSAKRETCFISCGFGGNGVFVVDVSDYDNPVELAGILTTTTVWGLALDEERDVLFVCNSDVGNVFVRTYDISDPSVPVLLTSHVVADGITIQTATGVAYDAVNQILFITTGAENGRIGLVDASNPSSLATLSVYADGTQYRGAYAVVLRPEIQTAFISCVGPSGNTGQIVSVDYSDPALPVTRHILDDDNWVNTWTLELIPDKDLLLGAVYSNVGGSIRFALYDISDPDLMVKGAEVIDDDLDSVVAAEYDRTRSVVFFSHINASISNQHLISSYGITDVNTVNKLHSEIWVTA